MKKPWTTRFGFAAVLAVMVFNMGFMALMPRVVSAQWATVNPDIVASDQARDALDSVQSGIRQALVTSLTAALMNLISYMANRFAYESAVWVASGGNAGEPLFNPLPTQDYMDNLAASVVADAYNSLVAENITGGILPDFGVYVSTDPSVLQAMRLGLRSTVDPQIAPSDYPEVSRNFDGYLATLSLEDLTPEERTVEVLSIVSEGFNPNVNEVGAGLQVLMKTQQTAYDTAQIQAGEKQLNDGFLSVTDPITGQQLTPASFVSEELFNSLFAAKELPTKLTTSLLGNSDGLIGIGANATSIFTNTLLSELMRKWRGGLFEDVADYPEYSSNYDPFDPSSGSNYDADRVAESFSSILSFRPLEVTDYSLLSELSSCPATVRGSTPGLFNCAMDTSFASAVSRADAGAPLTLSEAIDEGYIDGDWPLIPSSDTARNQDLKCYTYGFCHSNLVKLRRARVIPVGWELAAESSANSETDPVTLQEVMDGFYDCNAEGERDDANPWCHLIDPDWVLRFPDTQCRTLAYGQMLQSSGTSERQQECVDIQSCVQEDAFGNCIGGYGYCVREENTWRFRGDSCPAAYASCLSFTDEDGTNVDFLTNTLDYGDCNEGNEGCLWYATSKELNDEGAYDWPDIPSVPAEDEDADAYKNRIYFNSSVETCDEDDAGCAQVVERGDDLSLNIITNGGFENDNDSDRWPDGWLLSGAEYNTEDDVAYSGDAAVNPAGGAVYRYGTVLQQSRFYTWSFYASDITEESLFPGVTRGYIWMTDEDGDQVELEGTSFLGDCTTADVDGNGISESIFFDNSLVAPEVDVYERFSCTFTVPSLADKSQDIYAITSFYGGQMWIDNVQLEQGEDATGYHSGYNQDVLAYDYVKLPPAYLGCIGSDDDPEECQDYAGVCTEQEAGCTRYSPTNGDPDITGVVSELDTCPAICSGYDTFRQEETRYEPAGAFPVYFIPSTADACSEDAVGCDEFTNLETEETEYYTDLRACLTQEQADSNGTDDGAATFYTWEGSDEEGFQLKTWRLLESDLDGYTSITHAVSGLEDDAPGAAPCTNWQMDPEDGETIECIDDADGDGLIDSDTEICDERADILENPDCREFYDVDGDIHYRQWSETVTVTDSCVAYRKSDTVGDDATERGENCEASGGFWDTGLGACRYFGYAGESTSCDASESGCRSYTGGRSGNSRVALKDLFENDTLSQWDTTSAEGVSLSNESVASDGHSLSSDGQDVWAFTYDSGGCTTEGGCESAGASLGGSCTVSEGETYCGTLQDELFTGKTYTLSFWAKGETDLDVGFDIAFDGSSPSIDASFDDAIELTSAWQQFSIGPLDMNADAYPEFGNGTTLVFSPTSSGTFYIDNVTLREGEDNITVIKDSWVTPATCDENINGDVSPQYHLGCQEYTDQDLNTVYAKSFSRLCDEDKVGCDAYYVTHESEETSVAVYNATCYNTDASGGGWEEADQATTATTCHLFTTDAGTAFDTNSPELCTIIAGEDSCQFDFADWFVPEPLLESESNLFHIEYGPDATIVPADEDAYLIVDDSVRCRSANAGCQELGQPTFSADQTAVASWETVYYLNDPDAYDDILCADGDLFCEAWDAGSEGTWYFKNPGAQVCEYRSDITIGGETYDGWFREGTNEFCYGTGTCSDASTRSCTTDADCYDTATDTDFGTCEIDSGSYVIGGVESGIWRNGDEDYTGWVGQCTPAANGCTEFQDVLDIDDDEIYGETDGQSYYFIDNTALDEQNLLSSQRCNGQVSQKAGCTLFNDTGDTNVDYSATASYIASSRADDLYGDRAFALVDPIDCSSSAASTIITPGGEEVDLCAQRCVWENADLDQDFDPAEAGSVNDLYTVGGSCYSDSDCGTYESDIGDLVKGSCEATLTDPDGTLAAAPVERLENDSNRVMKVVRDRTCSEWLACASSYTVWDEDAGQYRTVCDAVDLCTEYSGDSSASFCSQWDPDDPEVVFDIDRYVGRDVSWYGEEYSGYSVPDMFPIQHLTQINTAPPEGFCDLSATPDAADYDENHGTECITDAECGSGICVSADEAEENYELGYSAGSCDERYGESCTIGYCENSGSACADDLDCNGGADDCIVGICYNVSETTCSEDADCGSGQECLAGQCVSEAGDCETDFTCYTDDSETTVDADATCFTSSAAKEGSCYSGTCFVASNGGEHSAETSEGMTCRAYPEADSPFGEQIVEEWSFLPFGSDVDADRIEIADEDREEVALERIASGELTLDMISGLDRGEVATDNYYGSALPTQFRNGFDAVETCAPGEDCVCSYTRIGNANTSSQFVGLNTDLDAINITGVCSADSPVAGALCGDDDDCRYYDATYTVAGDSSSGFIGNCEPFTSSQDFIGLEGYCLERDTGRNINGDQNTGACLTWLPVDQIAGATDLYAKYKTAGFFEETHICSDTRAFVNLYPSNIAGNESLDSSGSGDSGMACAESRGDITKGNSFDKLAGTGGEEACYENAECPEGYFAIVGQAAPKDSYASGYANDCAEPIGDGGGNDCPYICVPEGSVREEAGTSCVAEPPEEFEDGSWGTFSGTTSGYYWAASAGDYGSDTEWGVGLGRFSDLVESYADCVVKGVEYTAEWEEILTEYQRSSNFGSSIPTACRFDASDAGSGFRCLHLNWEVYPACKELLEVANSEESYAFTDVLYQGSVTTDDSAFAYDNALTPKFGFAEQPPTTIEDVPLLIAACTDEAYGATTDVTEDSFSKQDRNYITYPANMNSCTEADADVAVAVEEGLNHDPASSPQARSFISFAWSGIREVPSWSWDTLGETSDDVYGRISSLFAKFDLDGEAIFSWDSEGADYDVSEWDSLAEVPDVREEVGSSPTIWAVDTDNCGSTYCEEGSENAVTINGVSEGDVEATGGYFRAIMKFFAAADKDQLPIRQVIVDWRDGSEFSGSTGDDNYYKNRRGLRDDIDTETETWCDTDSEWGMTARSCDPNPFHYSHNYRCWDPEGLPTCTYDDDGDLEVSPCTEIGEACYFQPRVHVRDNWGWCTGVCEGDGCFDEDEIGSSFGNCSYVSYPDRDPNIDPWVYYDGVIRVEP